MTTTGVLEEFRAKGGTVFFYRPDLTDEIYICMREEFRPVRVSSADQVAAFGVSFVSMQVPAEDFIEFAAHLAKREP